MDRCLIVFLKYPSPGRVKTRLAEATGPALAARIYRRLVTNVFRALETAPLDRILVFHDPPGRAAETCSWIRSLWPSGVPPLEFLPQSGGSLGDRLHAAFAAAFAMGSKKAAAIGTDCVEISSSLLAEAWHSLDSHDVVFGPTPDGGYYLIGLREADPRLFQVPWSSPETLAASLAHAAATRRSVHLLPPLPDIDTLADWVAEQNRIFSMTSTILEPITFVPLYQERVWGGRAMAQRLHRNLPPGRPIGESWEIVDRPEAQSVVDGGTFDGMTLGDLWSQHREAVFGIGNAPGPFPILLKILDAREALSIQVHPPERMAADLGGEPKTEMWYIAHAEPGARLHAGLRTAGITPDSFREALEAGNAEPFIHVIQPRTSDVLFIPSGRLHAIGAGLLIYEIQENSDTTYRVYDWNRPGLDGKPRDLHLDEALKSIDFDDVTPGLALPQGETLVSCRRFDVARWDLSPSETRTLEPCRFAIFTVLDGAVRCGGREFGTGAFFLVPASGASRLPLEAGHAGASVLRTTLPRDWQPRQQLAPLAGANTGFYRQLRSKVMAWAETKTGRDNPWLRYVLLAPDFFHLLLCLVADPEVPAKSKVTLAGVIAYFILPMDLLPEGLIGPVGYLDDVALAAFALNQLLSKTSPDLLRRHWAGDGDVLELVQEVVKRADDMIGGGLVNKIREKLGV